MKDVIDILLQDIGINIALKPFPRQEGRDSSEHVNTFQRSKFQICF